LALLDPPDVTDQAFTLLKHIDTPEWRADPVAQLGVIRLMRGPTFNVLPGEVQRRLPTDARISFSKIEGQNAARWDAILRLHGDEDIYRALQYVPLPDRRQPSELVYPKTGWLGTYLRWAQEGEVPLGMHFWAAVSLLGAACKRNVFMDRGSFFLYPAHGILLVGHSGLRKTQALTALKQVLSAANRFGDRWWRSQMDRPPAEVPFYFTRDPRLNLLPNDVNFLGLLKKLRGNIEVKYDDKVVRLSEVPDSCGMLCLGELGSMLSKDGFSIGKTIDTLIEMLDAPDYYHYSSEKQGEVKLENVALSLVAATTPNWIQGNLTQRMSVGGFTSRLLFIYRANDDGREYAEPMPLDPLGRDALGETLLNIAQLEKTPLRLTVEAREWFLAWYHLNKVKADSPSVDPRVQGYFRRKDGHLLRLAMVLSISELGPKVVGLDHLKLASAILDHEETGMLECFMASAKHPDSPLLEMIFAAIDAAGPGGVGHSALMRRFYHQEGIGRRFGELVMMLIAMGRVEKVPNPLGRALVYRAVQGG
jgi:hypothetical protein